MDLRLGAIDTTNVNKTKGGKEGDNQKISKIVQITSILESGECIHGKCMNMSHAKEIASWAQPNPILPAHKEIAHI